MNIVKIRSILANLSLSILVLVICFVIAEFVVRSLYKDETTLFPPYHTDAQYGQFTLRKLRPNSVFWHTSKDGSWKFTINKQGFRNYKDFDYSKTEGTIRIMSLGDSQTQGYEVSQDYTFSAVMEKYLNAQGYRAEVINTGISGFSTAEELLFLENEGIKYKPDFVVLAFYTNDLRDNVKANLFKLDKNDNLVIQKKEYIPGVKIQNIIYELPLVKLLSENSYSYSLLFNSVWNYLKTRVTKKASNRIMEHAKPTKHKFSDYHFALTSALIKRMYGFCRKNNIKLLIVDIPRIADGKQIKSSFYGSLSQDIPKYSDAAISSDSLISDYAGVAELHRPHGQRHISEFTHTLLGVAIAKKIISLTQ